MMISDKQALRRYVKQIVRHAEVVETMLDFDVAHGEMGVEAMLGTCASLPRTPSELSSGRLTHTPLGEDAAAMFAALDALDLPVHDLSRSSANGAPLYAGRLHPGDSRCDARPQRAGAHTACPLPLKRALKMTACIRFWQWIWICLHRAAMASPTIRLPSASKKPPS